MCDRSRQPFALYTDASVLYGEDNSTPVAGTWAWVFDDGDNFQLAACGVIPPEVIPPERLVVSLAETYAAMLALDWFASLPFAVNVNAQLLLHADNMVIEQSVAGRQIKGKLGRGKFMLPPALLDWRDNLVRRLGKRGITVSCRHVKAHPSQSELHAGVSEGGHPVSEWNVLCDHLCRAAVPSELRMAKATWRAKKKQDKAGQSRTKQDKIDRANRDSEARAEMRARRKEARRRRATRKLRSKSEPPGRAREKTLVCRAIQEACEAWAA